MFPIIPASSASASGNKGIFGYGGYVTTITNLVSNTGVVADDVAGVGSARDTLAACEYGGDKGIFGFGTTYSPSGKLGSTAVTNLVSNEGVVASDQATVTGTGRRLPGACSYSANKDKGLFGFGYPADASFVAITNLVSNAGVVASDTAGVAGVTGRAYIRATEYGGDKGIFFGGYSGPTTGVSNLISNIGVVVSDTAAVGTARYGVGGCGYGTDTAIFGFGYDNSTPYCSITNLVSNTGVVAADQAALTGTGRSLLDATQYGGDKGIFGYGSVGGPSPNTSVTNLVSNTGVVSNDVTGVGTARADLAACSWGS